MNRDFDPGEIWYFPPFFTLQQTSELQCAQMDQWISLLNSWQNHLGKRKIIDETYLTDPETPMFYNGEIERKISDELYRKIKETAKERHLYFEEKKGTWYLLPSERENIKNNINNILNAVVPIDKAYFYSNLMKCLDMSPDDLQAELKKPKLQLFNCRGLPSKFVRLILRDLQNENKFTCMKEDGNDMISEDFDKQDPCAIKIFDGK